MPHTTERLLSDWPSEFNRPGDRRPKPIDPELIRNMKMVNMSLYTAACTVIKAIHKIITRFSTALI